jgi:hypothetical protein
MPQTICPPKTNGAHDLFIFEFLLAQETANVLNYSLCNTAVKIEWNKNHCNLCIINKETLNLIYVMIM